MTGVRAFKRCAPRPYVDGRFVKFLYVWFGYVWRDSA